MSMLKPTKPSWAYGDPDYIAEPPLVKRIVGWIMGERPPRQWFNWLFLKNKEWHDWSEDRTDYLDTVMLSSLTSLSWDGANLVVPTGGVKIKWRDGASIKYNTLAAGTYALADGEYLAAILSDTSATTLASGTYATLAAGQECIIASASLIDNEDFTEILLFGRVGTSLEIPVTKEIIPTGTTFHLGQTDLSALPPIGTIIPFLDYNNVVTYNANYWQMCNGGAIAAGPLAGQNTPDMSNRYLVGFGTETGGNIGSAAWSATAIGLASHQANLQHTHDIGHGHANNIATGSENSHTHDMGSHNHSFSSSFTTSSASDHRHLYFTANGGTSDMETFAADGTHFKWNDGSGYNCPGDDGDNVTSHTLWYTDLEGAHSHTGTAGGTTGTASGTSGAGSSHNHSITGGVTSMTGSSGNGGSTTQSVQPRSIPCRYLLRIQ